MGIKTTLINGDVAVGRNVAAGGDLRVAGRAIIGHNLKVEGWLEAENIKDVNKGFFLSADELSETYPNPHDGWIAGVGASTPFTAYIGKGGEWTATGGTIEIAVDMSLYDKDIAALRDGKVDKEDGKGLSSNDFTDEEKARLERNTSDIETNTEAIKQNATDIASVVTDLATLTEGVKKNTSDITKNASDITSIVSDLAALSKGVTKNTSDIETVVTYLSSAGRLVIRDSKSLFPATGEENALYLSRSNATLYYWGEAGMYVPIEGGGSGGDIPWERIVTEVSVEYPEHENPDRLCVVSKYGDEEGTELQSVIPLASGEGAGLMSVSQNTLLKKLEEKVFPLSLSLSLEPDVSLLEMGVDTIEDAVLSWRAYVDGSEVLPDSATVREQCPDLGIDTTTEVNEQQYGISVLAATTTLTVSANYEGRSATGVRKVTFVYPTYMFFSTDPAIYEQSLIPLENKQALSTNITYNNISLTNDKGGDAYLYIVSPYTPSEVKSVSGLTIGIAGKVVHNGSINTYWRSDDPLAQGEWVVSTR